MVQKIVAMGSTLRCWALRRELLVFLPAVLLVGATLWGEPFLVTSAIAFPVAYALAGLKSPGPDGDKDGLTGLSLRPAVTELLDRTFSGSRSARRTTIAFAIAVDEFETLEERFGLAASEEVLRKVGERIAIALRGTDIVARIDKATFAAAFGPVQRADIEAGLQVAARIQDAVRQPILIGTTHIHATCSVGFCLAARTPVPSGAAALAAATEALHEAQASGPGAVRSFVTGRKIPGVPSNAESLLDALSALEAGQIRPWFQPQICTDTGKVSGFEALARWEHPERGVLGPADFLPALSEAGQLEQLGEVVLFHALTALKKWDRAGVSIPSVGVNFSPEELSNPRLPERIAWELDRFELAPDRLTIEILENVVAKTNDDCVVRTISRLAEMGCRIDLDDFGTGNASLTALRRFKVGRIKIDRSFVTNIDDDPNQKRMVAAILSMAERLDLETLAEGVERVGEHAILSQLGCGHVQGFGIARPMPFEDTIDWIRHRHEVALDLPALKRQVM